MNRWLVLFLALILPGSGSGDVGGSPPPGEGVSAYQRYRYRLEMDRDAKVCHHMSRVYNDAFTQPWSYFTHTHPSPWFPALLPGQEQPKVRSGLFSRFPESKEFSAIDWREGGMLDPIATSTVLVAKFDIDNDGTNDLVLKRPSMSPWQQGADDALIVLDLG